MTREEEIRQEIDLRLAGCFGYYSEGYKEGFIEGAKWADETIIDKACEWLLYQEEMIGISFEDDFIERFKKAMEP